MQTAKAEEGGGRKEESKRNKRCQPSEDDFHSARCLLPSLPSSFTSPLWRYRSVVYSVASHCFAEMSMPRCAKRQRTLEWCKKASSQTFVSFSLHRHIPFSFHSISFHSVAPSDPSPTISYTSRNDKHPRQTTSEKIAVEKRFHRSMRGEDGTRLSAHRMKAAGWRTK